MVKLRSIEEQVLIANFHRWRWKEFYRFDVIYTTSMEYLELVDIEFDIYGAKNGNLQILGLSLFLSLQQRVHVYVYSWTNRGLYRTRVRDGSVRMKFFRRVCVAISVSEVEAKRWPRMWRSVSKRVFGVILANCWRNDVTMADTASPRAVSTT